MRSATYTITFQGPQPEALKVGDELLISGKATVRGISAELVDVTSIGPGVQYLLGGVEIVLYANDLRVEDVR